MLLSIYVIDLRSLNLMLLTENKQIACFEIRSIVVIRHEIFIIPIYEYLLFLICGNIIFQ